MRKTIAVALGATLLLWNMGVARAETPAPIEIVQTVNASPDEVWQRWTTPTGLQAFLAPRVRIQPVVDGRLDVLFDPSQRAGQRGAERMRILAFEPQQRLMFTWNAPPNLPYARAQRSVVEIELRAIDATHTQVTLRNFAFGDTNEEWAMARELLDGAWRTVMRRLDYSISSGPVNWSNPPAELMYNIPSPEQLRATLAAQQ